MLCGPVTQDNAMGCQMFSWQLPLRICPWGHHLKSCIIDAFFIARKWVVTWGEKLWCRRNKAPNLLLQSWTNHPKFEGHSRETLVNILDIGSDCVNCDHCRTFWTSSKLENQLAIRWRKSIWGHVWYEAPHTGIQCICDNWHMSGISMWESDFTISNPSHCPLWLAYYHCKARSSYLQQWEEIQTTKTKT